MFGHQRKQDSVRVKDFTIADSEHLNKRFFVCDYRRDINKTKAYRDLKPTQALLISVEDYKKGCLESAPMITAKDIVFSSNVFVPILPNGNLDFKKHIPIFDNTGKNAREGSALFIFENESEAIEKYNELIDIVIDDLNFALEIYEAGIKGELNLMESKKI